MKLATLRNILPLFTRNFLLTPQTKSTPSSSFPSLISSARSVHRFYSFNDANITPTQNLNNSNDDVEVISDEELKRRISRLNEGDESAIPDIFEAILKRKLAGVGDDDAIMEELRRNSPNTDVKEEDFFYESDDSESDDEKGR